AIPNPAHTTNTNTSTDLIALRSFVFIGHLADGVRGRSARGSAPPQEWLPRSRFRPPSERPTGWRALSRAVSPQVRAAAPRQAEWSEPEDRARPGRRAHRVTDAVLARPARR